MISPKKRDWIIALTYVALIYATLGVVGIPLSFLRSHGWLRLTLATLYLSCCLGLLSLLVQRSTGKIWRYLVLLSVWAIYYGVVQLVKLPEEQVHFFEYGLVGVLFVRALRWDSDPTWQRLLKALVLATLSGTVDELLQGIYPNRHYDLHDIGLNFIAALLGLVLYQLIPPPVPKKVS